MAISGNCRMKVNTKKLTNSGTIRWESEWANETSNISYTTVLKWARTCFIMNYYELNFLICERKNVLFLCSFKTLLSVELTSRPEESRVIIRWMFRKKNLQRLPWRCSCSMMCLHWNLQHFLFYVLLMLSFLYFLTFWIFSCHVNSCLHCGKQRLKSPGLMFRYKDDDKPWNLLLYIFLIFLAKFWGDVILQSGVLTGFHGVKMFCRLSAYWLILLPDWRLF